MPFNDNKPADKHCIGNSILSLIGLAKHLSESNNCKGLISTTNLTGDSFGEEPHQKPCLLLSQLSGDIDKQGSKTGYSFYMANPEDSVRLQTDTEIRHWQQNLALTAPSSEESKFANIPFQSGWVGYYSYPNKQDKIAEFHYYPWCICLDHQSNDFHLLGQPDEKALSAFKLLTDAHKQDYLLGLAQAQNDFKAEAFSAKWQKTDYEKAFYKVQNYLRAGDCYQVNLTQPHSALYSGSAIDTLSPLYRALNPSYGCYFEGQDCQLVSVSPERFISINASGRLEAKPIKGTIKRSDNPKLDQQLIGELSRSAKNQAENLMIVDLLRNDLSISALPGSVKVDNLFELESHPNVHHLVSTISAQLKPEISPAVAIENAFPGGSITGAPKKRAMEIIEELEAQPRSLYCGSFGYYSDTGNTDFNILIRSLEFRDNTITCWGGGGITVDSDCDDEYEESLTKIRRIMETVEKI